jgi:transmembrane sensor
MAEEPLLGLPRRVQAQWTQRRSTQVRASIERRLQRRRSARLTVAASAVILAAGLVFVLVARQRAASEFTMQRSAPGQASPPRSPVVEPTATAMTADTELLVDPQGAGRGFVLRRGSARFVVPHDDQHPFRVRAGALVVEDLGTIFSVMRVSDTKSEVAVEEGQVAVLCQGSRVELGHGQRRTFACGVPETPTTVAEPSAVAAGHLPSWREGSARRAQGTRPREPFIGPREPAATSAGLAFADSFPRPRSSREEVSSPSKATRSIEAREGPAMGAKPSPELAAPAVQAPSAARPAPHQTVPPWQVLAERGQYREAYDSLRNEEDPPVRDQTHALLLAADTARLSGHSSEAVPYLRRILLQHGDDPRAHLAAFTLGRVLLDELGRPEEAAAAFERARAHQAPLAEDALAREVEAWARAGDSGRARALAREYQQRYPQGRRMRAVAKFGGLE